MLNEDSRLKRELADSAGKGEEGGLVAERSDGGKQAGREKGEARG